jgi:hypothetical protein
MKMNNIKNLNRKETKTEYSRMTFGCHKGKFLKEVPTDYIRWCVLNLTDAVQAEWFARELVKREPKLGKK